MDQLQAGAEAPNALNTWVETGPDAGCGRSPQSEAQHLRNDTSHSLATTPPCTGITTYQNAPAFGLLQHAAEQIPNRDALIYGDDHWTYRDLNLASIRAAAMLQRLGIQPGDRVGILLPNVPEYVIAANAIWRAGAVAIAISPLMVQSEVQELLCKTGCHQVICLDMLSHLVHDGKNNTVQSLLVSIRQHLPALHQLGYLWARHSRTGHWTLPTNSHSRWFWHEIDKTERKWQPISIDAAGDAAYILPTGGTTGSPKAVALSHTNMVANAWQQYQWTGGTFGKETMLAVLPFFHSYGMSATVMGGVAMGATLVLHHRFAVRPVIRLIEEHAPTVFHAVPAMLVAMNERFRSHPPKIEGMRWVISGGASLDGEVASEFSRHTGALVVEGYGLSEASPVTHVGHLFSSARYGTIGLPLPGTECKIVCVDEASNNHETTGMLSSSTAINWEQLESLPTGDIGELFVRGPQIMLGYWQDQAATNQAIRHGWLRTGDLAMESDDGHYTIVGRRKDLIITSGFNVYPSEVEEILREAPGVEDAAVIGIPDRRRGEAVHAFIVPTAGTEPDSDRLTKHCQRHLSKYKRPRKYEFCTGDLPRNFLGKVLRRKLRESSDGASNQHEENKHE
jgi:long-chain acyl-CoA synthetase